MKLTNERLVESANFLASLIDKPLPLKVSYAIARNAVKLENELKAYNRERNRLLDKYCIKDESGENKINENGQLRIADEHFESWKKDSEELLNIELDVDIHQFNVEDLMQGDYSMTPREIMLIDYMIKES